VTSATLRARLQERLASVQERIQAACDRSGRRRSDVTLIAVTKTVSIEVAAALLELGVHDLGENRPQELWRKAAALPASARWHLIGHLQSNKIEKTLPLAYLMHSVDGEKLLNALDADAVKRDRTVEVLLEVNASREEAKQGFAPEQVPELAGWIGELKRARVLGLMTMAAPEDDPERCRPTFALLRNLRDCLRTDLGPDHPLPHLSMGMTNDFVVAIEEGATLVRIGTALFEGIGE
jgi:pyridoxal phosphate enzyme (YggS family)